MGGLSGVVSKEDCVQDLFYGMDYRPHLGTRRGGIAVWGRKGFTRVIHSIENAPFRSRFEDDIQGMSGCLGIGCISDTDSQPLIVRSHLGDYAVSTVGRINNGRELTDEALARNDDVAVGLVAGIPDSGIAHAIGCANEAKIPYTCPFVKCTPLWPRSFMPQKSEKYGTMVDRIRNRPHLTTLQYRTLPDVVDAIGLPKEKVCTYCWDGVGYLLRVTSICANSCRARAAGPSRFASSSAANACMWC